MATSIVVNKLGNRRFTAYWPATATDAQALADAVLDGEYQIYEKIGSSGNDQVAGQYREALVMGKDDTSKRKLYLHMYVPVTKNEDDIYTALYGKTFSGVKFDTVYVLKLRDVGTPAQNNNGGGGGGN